MTSGPASLPAMLAGYRFKPRQIAFQGVRNLGRWWVKGYVGTVRGTAAHFPDPIEAAWTTAETILGSVRNDGADAGIALLTVHIGMVGAWLLLDWWTQGDMLRERHLFASVDDPTRYRDIGADQLGPSIWDLAVLAHERDAWLRHVLANPAGPDLEAYLADGLTATV